MLRFEDRPHNVSKIKIYKGDYFFPESIALVSFRIPHSPDLAELPYIEGELFEEGAVTLHGIDGEFTYDTSTYEPCYIFTIEEVAKRAVASAFGYEYKGSRDPNFANWQ